MKNFLKENWFKIIVALTCLLVGMVFFYYFVIYIPTKEKKEFELKQFNEQQAKLEKGKTECQKLCDKRAIEDKEYWSGGMTFESYCKYDIIPDICYFSGGGSTSKDNYWERYIKNAETNQKLKIAWNADFIDENDKKHSDYIMEYWNEHEKIFGF